MKSGKQRRQEIVARRKKLAVKRDVMAQAAKFKHSPYRIVPVNEQLLAPNNSYGAPDFVRRGYYVDRPFRCVSIVVKKKSGRVRSRNGGTKWPKASSTRRQIAAGHAAGSDENRARHRDEFISKVSSRRGKCG